MCAHNCIREGSPILLIFFAISSDPAEAFCNYSSMLEDANPLRPEAEAIAEAASSMRRDYAYRDTFRSNTSFAILIPDPPFQPTRISYTSKSLFQVHKGGHALICATPVVASITIP